LSGGLDEATYLYGFVSSKLAREILTQALIPCQSRSVDILAAVKRTAIPHHATFLGWSLNGVDASPKNA